MIGGAASGTLQPGVVLRDRWTIHAPIGAGTLATVYAATHRNGDRVAIKVLHPSLAHEPLVRERFLREGYIGNAIQHPTIVRVIDDDITPDDCPFLVMDLLEGATLESLRRKAGGALPLEEVLEHLVQLLDGLHAAHEKNVVHRDIKPDNLFVERNGHLRILDFGIARVTDAASAVRTKTGAILGTPAFMSPEQAAGRIRDVGPKADVWGVGATAFTLLSGERPYAPSPNITAMLNAILSKPPRKLADVCPDIPPAVAAIVDGALVRDIDKRWSARAMRDALLPLLKTRRPSSSTTVVATETDLLGIDDLTTKRIAQVQDEAITTQKSLTDPRAIEREHVQEIEAEAVTTIARPDPVTRKLPSQPVKATLPLPTIARPALTPPTEAKAEVQKRRSGWLVMLLIATALCLVVIGIVIASK